MKQLPDEKELAELVEMARIAAEKAKLTYETVDAIAKKWESRFEARRSAQQKQEALFPEQKSDRV